MEFPRHVFKNGGSQQRAGGTFSTQLAQDEAEHEALLADGWFATLPEAIAPQPSSAPAPAGDPAAESAPPADKTTAPTRDEIVQMLDKLGVIFDRRLGTPKLRKLVEEELKKSAGGAQG